MSELIMRGRYNDHRLFAGLLALTGVPRAHARHLRRVVVDATAVASQDGFARAVHDSGHQLLIDPMTPLLAGEQLASDNWARLPFADPRALTPNDLASPHAQARLVEQVVDFQIEHGATGIIPAYLHVDDPGGPWSAIQCSLWTLTKAYLAVSGLEYPVLPVVSVTRHHVAASGWDNGLKRLLASAASTTDMPLGLALSASSRPATEPALHQTVQIWRRARQVSPFFAWAAGSVGGLAVAMGASGYETGLCTREYSNVSSQLLARTPAMAAHADGPRSHGVYIQVLDRSIPKSAAATLLAAPSLEGDLVCTDADCCPQGAKSMLDKNRRRHAARARLQRLVDLDRIGAAHWQLNELYQRAAYAEQVASRLQRVAQRDGLRAGVDPSEYRAMAQLTRTLRAFGRRAVA